jgi:hypothetical protein
VPKIDDEILANIVTRELASADSWMDGELADQQATNLKYYHAEPFGNEKDGFSKVVTRDVLEAVEGIMPELMKIFTSGDTFVEFEPQGAEDVAAAEQATDYINYIFQRRCDGFSTLYNWFKDSLLMKNGLVKVGWEDEDQVEIHRFKGLAKDELEAFDDEDDVEVIDKEEDEDGLFDVKVRRTKTKGKPYVELIPSEEFRIKQRSRSIKESDFVAHVTDRTVGDMIESGFDVDDLTAVSSLNDYPDSTVEDARFSTPNEGASTESIDSPMDHERIVQVVDAYVRLFDESDKRNKVYHIIQVGNKVLDSEEVTTIPFINLSPIMMPHKFVGVSVADLVQDIQEIRSQLYRNTLDNLALANAGRYEAVENQVNLQDLVDNKIGGIVRVKQAGAVRQLPTPQLGQATFPFLQELDSEKEDRVGVSKMTQGLDPNALTSNTAATAVNQVMTAAQQKILLIARVFAETGVKELFLQLYGLARTHQMEEDVVRLRGRFAEVNPFDWADRHDMVVTVGIGNGNKDQQLYHLNNITTALQQIGNTQYGYLIKAENVHALATELIKNAGFKNTGRFISDPASTPPPEPQPSAEMVMAQGEAEKDRAEAALKQQQAQLDQQKLQLEVAKFEWQKKVEAAELGIEATQKRPVGIGRG